MALEVKKQLKESSRALIYSFTKAVQRSGILVQARKIQFKQRNKSRQMKKRMLLKKLELTKKYEKQRENQK